MIKSILAENLFLENKDATIIDVRTPAEFELGHIPHAINIPFLNNEERVIIGTTFKQKGRQPAILQGFELVGGKWADFIKEAENKIHNKKVMVHCWRGGMRSGAMAWALDMYGFDVTVLKGGYKSYRNEILKSFEKKYPLIVLSGKTGTGKTLILQELKKLGQQVIDLEHLVKHQGSSFGSMGIDQQPTQAQFENDLMFELQKMNLDLPIWIENESVVIGKRVIPKPFFQQIGEAHIVDIQLPIAHRINFLVKEYGVLDRSFLKQALLGISKRLGPEQTKNALLALEENKMDEFITWALQYYDGRYEKSQLKRKPSTIHKIDFDEMNPEVNAQDLLVFYEQIKNELI